VDHLRRRRRDEDEWRERAPQRDAPQGADTESLLDLQARAGNRAVTELVGAQGTDAGLPQVQRESPDAAPTATPDAEGKPRVDTMSIPELNVAVPIQSIDSSRMGPSGRGGSGRDREKKSTAGELTVLFAAEHFNPKLMEAMNQGREFGTVTITISTMTITLHGVIISGAHMGRESASISLSFSSMDFDPGPKERESPPAYDLGPSPTP
jgi:hypothetical protein